MDAEHALDPEYAAALGVDIDSMLVSQPDTGEQALEIADALVRSGAVDAVVVDSVAALTPRAEIEGKWATALWVSGPAHVPGAAEAGRLHRQDQLRGDFHQSAADEDWRHVRQPRDHHRRQRPEVYASVRLDVRRVESIKNGSDVIGNRTRVRVVKNKVAPRSGRQYSTSCMARAFQRAGKSWIWRCSWSWCRKSGSWFSIGDERIGQGRDNAKQYIMDRPELMDQLEEQIRENLYKLQNGKPKTPAKAADKPVSVSADDFSDED